MEYSIAVFIYFESLICNLWLKKMMLFIVHSYGDQICWELQGRKFDLAKKFRTIIVNHRWLEDCIKHGKRVPEGPYILQRFWQLLLFLDYIIVSCIHHQAITFCRRAFVQLHYNQYKGLRIIYLFCNPTKDFCLLTIKASKYGKCAIRNI